MRLKWLLLICLLGSTLASAQNSAPVLFFSDLTNGPATGNSDSTHTSNGGVYVTLYGNFLDSFTSVTLGGASCLVAVSNPSPWMWYERMTVQLQSSCSSGNFAVTTSAGTSNGIPFTVRSGKIYYVATSGKDGNAGSFSAPWGTLIHARNTIADGDTIYAENGVSATSDDGEGWRASYTLRPQWCGSGSGSGYSKALIAYPGATVTLGDINAGGSMAFRTATNCAGYYTFAGLVLRGGDEAAAITQGGGNTMHSFRFVGNDMTSPNASINAESATFIGGDINGFADLGNYIHNAATNDNPALVTALYHGWYFGRMQNAEIGWDTIAYVYGCRGMQIYSDGTHTDYNYSIHDNVIHDTQCDGIGGYDNLNPSAGYINIYNNLIYNAGKGPYVNGGNWACVYLTGASAGGTINVYSNTLYNCGSISNAPYPSVAGILSGGNGGSINVQNNIIYETTPKVSYVLDGASNQHSATGKNNLFYGIGSCNGCPYFFPNNFSGTVTSDPGFVNTGTDFHLGSAGSPANGAGATASPVPTYDHDALIRPSPAAIGAYEFAAGSNGGVPNPPTNLQAVVH